MPHEIPSDCIPCQRTHTHTLYMFLIVELQSHYEHYHALPPHNLSSEDQENRVEINLYYSRQSCTTHLHVKFQIRLFE